MEYYVGITVLSVDCVTQFKDKLVLILYKKAQHLK